MDAGVIAPSKTDLAYRYVRERIADGRYAPGHRLVLAQLAAAIGVSTVPVREAIRRLEAEGLVTFLHNVGAQVVLVDESEYTITMQTLAIVEGAATALALPALGPDVVARARALNDQLRGSLRDFDPEGFTRLNQEFHATLFERCPNPHMLDLVRRGWERMRALRASTFAFVPGRAQQSVDEHEHLLALIESGAEPIEVELAARRHRHATLDAFLRHHGATR